MTAFRPPAPNLGDWLAGGSGLRGAGDSEVPGEFVRRPGEQLTLPNLHDASGPCAEHIAKLIYTCRGGRRSWPYSLPGALRGVRPSGRMNPELGCQPFKSLLAVRCDGRTGHCVEVV